MLGECLSVAYTLTQGEKGHDDELLMINLVYSLYDFIIISRFSWLYCRDLFLQLTLCFHLPDGQSDLAREKDPVVLPVADC